MIRNEIKQRLRFFSESDVIELESHVPTVKGVYGNGKDIAMVVKAEQLNNKRTFWTDDNGLLMNKRVWNERPTWRLQTFQEVEVSQNYYPVTSALYIEDEETHTRMTYEILWSLLMLTLCYLG